MGKLEIFINQLNCIETDMAVMSNEAKNAAKLLEQLQIEYRNSQLRLQDLRRDMITLLDMQVASKK